MDGGTQSKQQDENKGPSLRVVLPDHLHREFKAYSARKGVSMTSIMRDAIRKMVEGENEKR